jgi:prepilin-type N-terminal cleavage/methylation domain-containing protein
MKLKSENITPKGMSLLEMLVALSMLSLLILLAFSLMNTSNRMLYSNRLHESMKEEAQRAIRYLDRDLIRAKKVFGRDTNYMNLMPSGIPQKVDFSKLPAIHSVGTFDPYSPDYTDTIFGNELFFAKIENSIQIDTPGGKIFELNLYKFVNVYIVKDMDRITRPYNYTLAMVKWESNNFADYWELDHLNKNESSLMKHIEKALEKDHNIYYCWDLSQKNCAQAFYRLGEYSTPASMSFQTSDVRYIVRPIDQTLGISFNQSETFPVKDDVPAFSAKNGMFPAGAEFGIIGPTSSRKVLIRLVIAGWARNDLNSYVTTTVVSAPEY